MTMKKLFLFMFIAFSCNVYAVKYFCTWGASVVGVKPEIPQGQLIDGGYEDTNIRISLKLLTGKFEILLYNKTSDEISVDWNKISYIDFDDVMHRTVSKRRDFTATTIPSQTALRDFVSPEGKKVHVNIMTGFWKFILFPYYTKHTDERNAWKQYFLGKKFSLYIPITINGKEISYRFVFEMDKMHVLQKNPDTQYTATKTTDFPAKRRGW
jgi:hypothetical protein